MLVKITDIKCLDGAQQDTGYFWEVENLDLYKSLENTSLSRNLKKTVKDFDIGSTTEPQHLLFSKWMYFFFL